MQASAAFKVGWVEWNFAGDFQEHRDVAMHAPLAAGLAAAQRREGRREVDMARDRAVPPLDHLVQIDAVVESRERLLGLVADLRQPQRRGELQLADTDAGRGEAREGVGRVLELHRAVADVVADAEWRRSAVARLADRKAGRLGDDRGARIGVQMVVEECDRLLDRLEEAARLRLEREHDLAPGAALQRRRGWRRAAPSLQPCGAAHRGTSRRPP